MNKRSCAMTAALLAVGLAAGTGAAQAEQTKTVAVHGHYTEPEGSFDGAQCWGLAAVTPECSVRQVGHATFTDTMWGDEYYDVTGFATPDGKVTYAGPASFNGGVVGCGTGSYIIDNSDGYVDMEQFDPLTNSAPGYNTWRVRPGSGTGELSNLVSGGGENHWREYFGQQAGDFDKAGEGDFTGTITCRS